MPAKTLNISIYPGQYLGIIFEKNSWQRQAEQ